jgi:ATP-dependent exoDNAse (exonuclease V) alpha subunit
VYFDQLYKQQKLIAGIYLSDLAKNVKELGYEIEFQGNGKWEIAGVEKEWIQIFSKRTYNIKKVENELIDAGTYPGVRKGRLRKIAVLKSRPKKDSSINEKQLRKKWEQEVPKKLIKQSVERYKNRPQPKNKLTPKDYIRFAYHSIHQTECLLTLKQILEDSLKLSISHFTIVDIEKEFFKMKANYEIVEVSKYINSKGLVTYYYTSKAMKETELEILNSFRFGMNSSDAFLAVKDAEKKISKNYDFLTNDQKKSLQYILTSKQQFMLVQGDAGTGKSFLFKSFKEIIENKNKHVHIQGLGFTGKAAQELQTQSGISSKTITSFLNESASSAHRNSILIIDEASMIGSLQANEILDNAKVTNSKVIVCGDCKQLNAISAGKFFKDLQELKIPYTEMNEILRQKNETMLKSVNLIRDYQTGKKINGIDEAFDLLKKNSSLTEVPNKTELVKSTVDAYLTSKNMDGTLVITASNKDRLELNKNIRSELKKIGKIDKKDLQTKISVPVNLSGIQRHFSQNYELKQNILIEQHDLTNDRKDFFNATIVALDPKLNSLQVLTQHNEIKQIHLRDNNIRTRIILYESQERNFSTGDKVIFLKNDRELNIQNGLTGKIEKIGQKGTFHIRPKNSKRLIKINPKKFPWLDHSYALSIHKSQGLTSSKVILLADTQYQKLNRTESFYVAISRAEKKVKIFTNDAHKLKEQFKEGQDKTSTLLPKQNLIKSNAIDLTKKKEIER